jgi:thioredoxin-like negative regulator of GroEL
MRALMVAAMLVALPMHARAQPAPPPPPLEQAMRRAADAGRPLLVEFSTEWCGPCQVLAERVLPDPEVQAALAGVNFVVYDAEKEPGRAAAARLRVSGYPTLVVLGADGREVDRVVGLLPAVALAPWVRKATARAQPSLGVLREQLARRPRDPQLLLSAARRALAEGKRAEARRWFDEAQRRSAAASPEGEAAGWEFMQLVIDDEERASRARLARAYLERYPAGAASE